MEPVIVLDRVAENLQRSKKRPSNPAVVTIDNEEDDGDCVIETCRLYEDAFFGPLVKTVTDSAENAVSGSRTTLQETSPYAPELHKQTGSPVLEQETTSSSSTTLAFRRGISNNSQLQRPTLSTQEHVQEQIELHQGQPEVDDASDKSEVESEAGGALPPVLQLPLDEVNPENRNVLPRMPFVPDPEPLPNEEVEVLRGVQIADCSAHVFVEHLRVEADAGRCRVCWLPFHSDQLRLGYLPKLLGAEACEVPARWVHAPSCLTKDDGLRLDFATEWIAISKTVSEEDRRRILGILGLRIPTLMAAAIERPIVRARLWQYPPAALQGWSRYRASGPGVPRSPPRSTQGLRVSAASLEARAILAAEGRSHRAWIQRRRAAVNPPIQGEDVDPARPPRFVDRNNPSSSSTPPHNNISNRGHNDLRERFPPRIPRSLLRIAPSFHFMQGCSEEPCIICHDLVLAGEEVRRLPCCHIFHRDCIDRWLAVKATCPLDNLTAQQLIRAANG